MRNLVLYTSDDGETRFQLRLEGDTVWLTQLEIAEELSENSTVKDSLTLRFGATE